MSDDNEQVWRDFRDAVNMSRSELLKWLDEDESKAVGAKSDSGGESVGHHSGRRIAAILDKKKSELTDDDYSHMQKVTGYVHRHLAQKPEKESIDDSKWRYSLMNWGHDPLKS